MHYASVSHGSDRRADWFNPVTDGPEALEPPVAASTVGVRLRKTKLCKHYLAGSCRYKGKCGYAHGRAELAWRPDLTKTKMCVSFLRGGCPDNNCTFAHGTADLRPIESPPQSSDFSVASYGEDAGQGYSARSSHESQLQPTGQDPMPSQVRETLQHVLQQAANIVESSPQPSDLASLYAMLKHVEQMMPAANLVQQQQPIQSTSQAGPEALRSAGTGKAEGQPWQLFGMQVPPILHPPAEELQVNCGSRWLHLMQGLQSRECQRMLREGFFLLRFAAQEQGWRQSQDLVASIFLEDPGWHAYFPRLSKFFGHVFAQRVNKPEQLKARLKFSKGS
eukprot:gb/GFBE01031067.1/.p1 GENE.gb/GFBE01031067.1/~~gb/GFBE01031067.1/.p1  ORF type:complete len:335 (+),score=29.40 gb/GFBE01031067.1/:1-1005(+)